MARKPFKCINCPEKKRCRDSFASWIFFLVGLIATVAMRVVTVLIHVEPLYGKIAWYIGVGGFFLFFVYKFRINQTRTELIDKHALMKKISQKKPLEDEDYDLISALLCSLTSKKEKVNYLFIFGLSAVAIILALYFDFFK